MNVLVTGGAGFIGSHLADGLLALGHRVVALDNLSTGSRDNVRHLSANSRFRLVKGSVLDKGCLEPLVADSDLIFHLAAAVGVKVIVQNLIDSLENNVSGTATVLKLAQALGNKKVVLASSSEVYGKSSATPWKEDGVLALGPTSVGRWGYACTKVLDEFLALAYHKEKGLPVVILRFFNIVGPRQSGHYGMVIPRFVSQALEGRAITVYGDGQQSRCFTHVDAAVDAMVRISQVPEAEGQVFNVGSQQEVSIGALAKLVKDTLNSTSPIVHVPYDRAYGAEFEDVPRRIPDNSKIQQYIDFRPHTDLRRVIKDVADDQEKRPEKREAGLGGQDSRAGGCRSGPGRSK